MDSHNLQEQSYSRRDCISSVWGGGMRGNILARWLSIIFIPELSYLARYVSFSFYFHTGDILNRIYFRQYSDRLLPLCVYFHRSMILNLMLSEGKGGATKSDEFSEQFQTVFDPPHFRKILLQFFIMDMVAYMQGGMRAR